MRRWLLVFTTAGLLFVPTLVPSEATTATTQQASAATTWSVDRDTGQASIVVLGDSISSGHGCFYPNCWPGRVAWEWPLTNLARSGAMPQDLLPNAWCWRQCWYDEWGASTMSRLDQLQPSLVIVALGTVNYGYIGQHPDDYMTALRALCDSIRQHTPRSTILLVHENGFRASHGQVWIWVEYGRRMDTYVATQTNMGYLDVARDMPWGDTDTSGAYLSDTVHPNNAGQIMMAIAVIGKLRAL